MEDQKTRCHLVLVRDRRSPQSILEGRNFRKKTSPLLTINEFSAEVDRILTEIALQNNIVLPSYIIRHLAALLVSSFYGLDMLNPHLLLQRYIPKMEHVEESSASSIAMFELALQTALNNYLSGESDAATQQRSPEMLVGAIGDVALLTNGLFLSAYTAGTSTTSLPHTGPPEGEIGFRKSFPCNEDDSTFLKQSFKERCAAQIRIAATRGEILRAFAEKAYHYAAEIAYRINQYNEILFSDLASLLPTLESVLGQTALGVVPVETMQSITAMRAKDVQRPKPDQRTDARGVTLTIIK